MALDPDYNYLAETVHTNLARYPALAIGLPLIGGFLSAVPSHHHIKSWYSTLDKPTWAPPDKLFAPAWSVLYLSIGYASHLVALKTGPNTFDSEVRGAARLGLCLYGANLVLNFAWSPLMFWRKQIGAALVTCAGTTLTAALFSYQYFQVDAMAGYLTVPYIAWLTYATALNYDVWIKNASGPTADKARRIGKDVNNAAGRAKKELDDEVKQAKKVAKEFEAAAERDVQEAKDAAAAKKKEFQQK